MFAIEAGAYPSEDPFKSPTLGWSTVKQAIDWARKACQGQTP
jgi:hypothetical protein